MPPSDDNRDDPRKRAEDAAFRYRRRKAEERRRAMALSVALKEPSVSDATAKELAWIADAEEKLRGLLARAADPKIVVSKAERRERKELTESIRVRRRRVFDARNAQLNQHWAGHAISETVRLAASRSEDVEEETTEVSEWLRDEDGALVKGENEMPVLKTERAVAYRALSRTGLSRAFVNGDLGPGVEEPKRLRDIGHRYRQAYEVANANCTPESKEIRSTLVPEPQMASLRAWEDLNIMRGDHKEPGLELHPLNPRQRRVLDLICGEDITLGTAARSLRFGVPSTRNALRKGLCIVGENLKAEAAYRKALAKARRQEVA